jgi:patatin-like phospholipase/acyl hydrolase
MDETPFRILSLDGGIMRALAALALATSKRATGRRIVQHFDLITRTSTDGIIAIGLAMGASAGLITPPQLTYDMQSADR